MVITRSQTQAQAQAKARGKDGPHAHVHACLDERGRPVILSEVVPAKVHRKFDNDRPGEDVFTSNPTSTCSSDSIETEVEVEVGTCDQARVVPNEHGTGTIGE